MSFFGCVFFLSTFLRTCIWEEYSLSLYLLWPPWQIEGDQSESARGSGALSLSIAVLSVFQKCSRNARRVLPFELYNLQSVLSTFRTLLFNLIFLSVSVVSDCFSLTCLQTLTLTFFGEFLELLFVVKLNSANQNFQEQTNLHLLFSFVTPFHSSYFYKLTFIFVFPFSTTTSTIFCDFICAFYTFSPQHLSHQRSQWQKLFFFTFFLIKSLRPFSLLSTFTPRPKTISRLI